MDYLPYVIPAALTAILNLIFYVSTKKSVDSALERYKISYSGVFKEKIDIYRNLLDELHELNYKLEVYQFYPTKEYGEDIRRNFNSLIKIYSANEPFLSDSLIQLFVKIVEDLQSIFDALDKYRYLNDYKMKEEDMVPVHNAYMAAINKLRDNKVRIDIKKRIISEMKADLQA